MKLMGQEGLNADNFRNIVMLANATLNDGTIFSATMNPKLGLLDAIPVDSDYPDMA